MKGFRDKNQIYRFSSEEFVFKIRLIEFEKTKGIIKTLGQKTGTIRWPLEISVELNEKENVARIYHLHPRR